jgi:hypothetical protein
MFFEGGDFISKKRLGVIDAGSGAVEFPYKLLLL